MRRRLPTDMFSTLGRAHHSHLLTAPTRQTRFGSPASASRLVSGRVSRGRTRGTGMLRCSAIRCRTRLPRLKRRRIGRMHGLHNWFVRLSRAIYQINNQETLSLTLNTAEWLGLYPRQKQLFRKDKHFFSADSLRRRSKAI